MPPWLPGPVDDAYDDAAGAAEDAGEAVVDVPADAVNATTGTGENLGWFGVIDRQADPRSWGEGQPDWADPSEATTGISGFFQGATGATGGAVDEATQGTGRALVNNPKLLLLVAVGLLVVLMPYASTASNLTE